jgi:hypothetical protein
MKTDGPYWLDDIVRSVLPYALAGLAFAGWASWGLTRMALSDARAEAVAYEADFRRCTTATSAHLGRVDRNYDELLTSLVPLWDGVERTRRRATEVQP